MYKCVDCQCEFDIPREYAEDLTPSCAFEGGSFIKHYSACPNCGGNYEELVECFNCGCKDYASIMNNTLMGWLCEDCVDEIEYLNGGY